MRKARECPHNVYIKGLCGDCGARINPPQSSGSVSMIHSVPELKVRQEYAKEIGRSDQERLIQDRKLVLLVDLDQTILHTTHERVEAHADIYSFCLMPGHPTYYTKLRPHLEEFLERIAKFYELHIFTFGCRRYAHKIASIIDPDQVYFGNRILSRDESVDQYSKKGNLNNLFPCGDAMVCIIDDRADVWADAGNLIQVKPYSYFKTSISDGAQTPSSSTASDDKLDEDAQQLEKMIGLDTSYLDPSDDQDNEARAEDKTTQVDAKGGHPGETSSSDPKPSCSGRSYQEQERSCLPVEDLDEQLVKLPRILEWIHLKWYQELDDCRRFLAEGESYRLPDIKDIIARYLRRY